MQCPTGKSGPYIDPIHPGVRCETNDDCVSSDCNDGFCRCTNDVECGNDFMDDPVHPRNKGGPGLRRAACPTPREPATCAGCSTPTPTAAARGGSTASRSTATSRDRWASSRPLWNQHAYNITNINDDGTVPRTSQWKQNYLMPGLNNYRQNVQGRASPTDLADITGVMNKSNVCQQVNAPAHAIELHANVCNRGLRGIGANMPATFYLGDSTADPVSDAKPTGPVPVAGCLPIQCT